MNCLMHLLNPIPRHRNWSSLTVTIPIITPMDNRSWVCLTITTTIIATCSCTFMKDYQVNWSSPFLDLAEGINKAMLPPCWKSSSSISERSGPIQWSLSEAIVILLLQILCSSVMTRIKPVISPAWAGTGNYMNWPVLPYRVLRKNLNSMENL